MAELFIRRPILAIVLSILMTLAGLLALKGLPIEEYPAVTPPVVQVSASYPGADAQTVEQTVVQPLEQAINGTEHMLYLESRSTNDGRLLISASFETGTNLDTAATLVQNRVAQALGGLPEEVKRQGVTVAKASTSILMLVALDSPNGTYDQTFLANYASLNVRDALLRVTGVGQVNLLGANDYSMRVWLDPTALAARNLTVGDVIAAIREQNVLVPAGTIGAPPQPSGVMRQLTVRPPPRLSDPAAFADIVVRTGADGAQVRVRDVGRVELGSQSYSMVTRLSGKPTGMLAIYAMPGGDALATAHGVEERLEALKATFPSDVAYHIAYDTTPPIHASIHEITHTLLEAVVLVVLVVFLFLQDWRATLIPLLTVPVALVGALAVFPLLGFSINVLTMFGLVLAIGIVVDDAIVVVEAVIHHLEHGLDRVAATRAAMREVTGPVVAIALILCAVFVPVALMGGLTGQLYRQFALTIAVAVIFSAINALTLSPALCALFLRAPEPGRGPLGRFFGAFNRAFDAFTARYTGLAGVLVRRSMLGLGIVALAALGVGGLMRLVPGGFLPDEDKGVLLVNVSLPPAASLERTDRAVREVEGLIAAEPTVETYATVAGFSALTGAASSSSATVFVTLKPWAERRAASEHLDAVLGNLNRRFATLSNARAFGFGLPPIPGLGAASGYSFELEDRGGHDARALADTAQQFLSTLAGVPEVTGSYTGFSADVPQLAVDVDRDQVRRLGVPIDSVFGTLQATLGGAYVNDFPLYGRLYQVYVAADAPFRREPADVGRFYVRSLAGSLVPMAALVRSSPTQGPDYTTRFNLYPSARIVGQPAAGQSSGAAMAALASAAAKALPAGYAFEWSGQSFQEARAAGEAPVVFGLAILFVFLLLAALYESWSLPFAVLLGTPFALLGALLGTQFLHLSNNLYTQVGIVLLIGLAAKNAILIVEFAKARRESGASPEESALDAARLRLRPILMTSFAFILGCVPLVLATGSGAAARVALGAAVVYGMIAATVFGLIVVPSLYTFIARLTARSRAP